MKLELFCLHHFKCFDFTLDPEILSDKGLSKLPVGRNDVPWSRGSTVTGCDTEGKWLTNENSIRLPVLSPVPSQTHPTCLWTSHARLHDVSCSRHVRDQHQVEVTVTVDREPYPSTFPTCHPIYKPTFVKLSNLILLLYTNHFSNYTLYLVRMFNSLWLLFVHLNRRASKTEWTL